MISLYGVEERFTLDSCWNILSSVERNIRACIKDKWIIMSILINHYHMTDEELRDALIYCEEENEREFCEEEKDWSEVLRYYWKSTDRGFKRYCDILEEVKRGRSIN